MPLNWANSPPEAVYTGQFEEVDLVALHPPGLLKNSLQDHKLTELE